MSVSIAALSQRIARALRSKLFWRLILGLFLLEALWFVFSAQYPMAFDENYHFGLIQLHAQQWLPFFTGQPHNASVYGAVVRDPSYLYHWLMSYPYRFTTLFTHNQTIQIIVLRLINVGLFVGGLLLYRRLIRRIGVSEALNNSLFLIFILVPVVPFLAATINYDNLFFLAVPLTIILTLRLVDGFADKRVDAQILLLLVAILFLSSLIKYSFLPVFVVVAVYVIYRFHGAGLLGLRGARSLATSFRALTWLRRLVLIVACLLAVGLFAERYGGNVVRYHNPVPACDAVISQDECIQYGPYGRDHTDEQEKSNTFRPNIFTYMWQWTYGMWYRLFFAINYDYATAPPLLLIGGVSVVSAILAAGAIIVRFRALFAGKPTRQFILWLTFGYVLALFMDGFTAYVRTGQPVAINGRYLIPFLPFLFAFGGLAWAQILHDRTVVKSIAVSLVIAVFLLQGGGTMTFIIRSGDTWMWNNTAVRSVNRTVRSVAWPFILGKGIY